MLIFLLAAYPLCASVNCLDNSTHLAEDIDYHKIHPVACDCPCTTIRKNICTECGHLQNAATYVVVLPTKVAQQEKKYHAYDPRAVLQKLAYKYLKRKK